MCSNQELKDAIDRLEKSLIASRDVNHTVSEIMLSFQEKLDAHAEDNKNSFQEINEKLEESMKRIEPALKIITTAKNTRRGVIWIAGFVGALAVIIGTIYKIKEWIRN